MASTRFFTASSFVIAIALVLLPTAFCSAPSPLARSNLHRRLADTAAVAQVPQSCLPSGPTPCMCPTDLNNDSGVLINVYPGYQCAYPGGACTWSDADGSLQNTHQTNCPENAPCNGGVGTCTCPTDNNWDEGVLINQFRGYQCAYTGGACTWDYDGELQNTGQTNCPTVAKCVTPN